MDFGDIIKRSWKITWRYKALWVLGLFAGISGCQSSGGSSGGGNSFSGNEFSGGPGGSADFERFGEVLLGMLPLLVGLAVLMVVLGVLWWILGLAATGGLITGVNSIEEGRTRRLPELWADGFGRFWALLGLDLLLGLPVFLVAMVMLAGIFVPLFTTIAAGNEPGLGFFGSLTGSLCIGIPVLLVMSFFLGIMRLIGLRYLMLGGQGVIESAGNGWRFLRARFKDTFLMWLINGGLNIAASFVLAIPVVVVALVAVFPIIGATATESWGALVGVGIAAFVFLWLISAAYTAVWGTFTSSLWTVFFRKATGMEVVVAVPGAGAPAPAAGARGVATGSAGDDAPREAASTGAPAPVPSGEAQFPPAPPAPPSEFPPAPPAPPSEFPPAPPAPPADA